MIFYIIFSGKSAADMLFATFKARQLIFNFFILERLNVIIAKFLSARNHARIRKFSGTFKGIVDRIFLIKHILPVYIF